MEPLDAFAAAAVPLTEAVRSMPPRSRWLLHCDTDADGLCGGAVAAMALQAVGHRYIVRASRDKATDHYESCFESEADGHIFIDKGSSHLDTLAAGAERTGRPVLVLDHHNLTTQPKGVLMLNPRAVGLDGSRDASAATTAVRLAISLIGDSALWWAGTGLVGAIGDWQHMGGWHGWNAALVEAATAAGTLDGVREPAFPGADLADGISRRPDLKLPGLSGDRAATTALLRQIEVPATGDAEALDAAAKTRLMTGLTLHGLASGATPDELRGLSYRALRHPTLDLGLRPLFRMVDACGREGHPDVGVALLMGDPLARQEAQDLFTAYRAALTDGLHRLRDEGTTDLRAVRHITIERPEYTGMVGGLGMTVVLEDKRRPMVVTALRPDGQLQVSTRGTHEQVEAGLDLGLAVGLAASAVDAEGGGHPIAAGAVIAADKQDGFLAALDEALMKQGFLEGA